MSDVVRCFENIFLYLNRTIRCRRIVQGTGVSSGDDSINNSVSKMNVIKTILLTSTKWFASDHFPDVRKMVCFSAFVKRLWVFVCLTRQMFLIKAEFSFKTGKETQLDQFVGVNKMMGDNYFDKVWC